MKPIKVGDLVMVVRPTICCGATKSVGLVATVVDNETKQYVRCIHCSDRVINDSSYLQLDNGKYCHVSRLKRIDPPATPETVEHDSEVTA